MLATPLLSRPGFPNLGTSGFAASGRWNVNICFCPREGKKIKPSPSARKKGLDLMGHKKGFYDDGDLEGGAGDVTEGDRKREEMCSCHRTDVGSSAQPAPHPSRPPAPRSISSAPVVPHSANVPAHPREKGGSTEHAVRGAGEAHASRPTENEAGASPWPTQEETTRLPRASCSRATALRHVVL